ncbi:hypothetical protein PoB_007556600 [Plakobranchus ocellatus]|uniref:Uncharacterized protein n=1 Tax=Plakobranchus ocellatus TaxID=259542 RepID=A0AAV4DZ10_9GAST|nr:hypothetical protein PoB_007556600 [Plakobranchus ocellatus]
MFRSPYEYNDLDEEPEVGFFFGTNSSFSKESHVQQMAPEEEKEEEQETEEEKEEEDDDDDDNDDNDDEDEDEEEEEID